MRATSVVRVLVRLLAAATSTVAMPTNTSSLLGAFNTSSGFGHLVTSTDLVVDVENSNVRRSGFIMAVGAGSSILGIFNFLKTTIPDRIAQVKADRRQGSIVVLQLANQPPWEADGEGGHHIIRMTPTGKCQQRVGSRKPFLTVVGHDFETFAQQSSYSGAPLATSGHYTHPYWHKYNGGLARLAEAGRSGGPLQAPHAGHFIQFDNPDFVAQEVDAMLSRLDECSRLPSPLSNHNSFLPYGA